MHGGLLEYVKVIDYNKTDKPIENTWQIRNSKKEALRMETQKKNDAVNAWKKEVIKNRGVNAEHTLRFCRDIEEYALDKKDISLLGFAYYHMGETYYVLNDVENLFKYITKAINYLDESAQWDLVAMAYNILAITSYSRGNAPIAMDYYLTGLSYCKKYQLSYEENILNQNLGTLYMHYGQYREAQHYFERSARYLHRNKIDKLEYTGCIVCIYNNLGKCYMHRGMYEKAQEYIDKLNHECREYMQEIDHIYVNCFKILYYHETGHQKMRDECIHSLHKNISTRMPVMDVFDDVYELCQLLLQLDQDDVLWDIINILDELTKRSKIINLQRKIIALKIKYYRAHRDNAGYLQAAGLYYELTELMEKENQYMIMNMLNVRGSLEQANEHRKQMEAANEILQEKSETDQMTGLPNRYKLNDYSEKIFEQCKQEKKPLAIEILDIDFFKQYNDNYGHQAGDVCITAIADRLKEMQDEHTFCARYGGDEFIIIYDDMENDVVLNKAAKLRQAIMDLQMEHLFSKAEPYVTISQGICCDVPLEENKNWDFLHAADMMLYQVKRKSRNNISIGQLNSDHVQTYVEQ